MRKAAISILASVIICAAQVANAAAIYSLTSGNSGLAGYTGPFGSVSVSLLDSTHATVTFTASSVGGYQFLFGGTSAVDVNVNAASWTVSGFSASNGGIGFSPTSLTGGGSGNVSAFGVLNQTLDFFDGFTHSADKVSFTLTDTSGTWANDWAVLAANANNNPVAAHIFITTSPANAANTALVTGFASVPDGASTITLLGLGLLGIGSFRRVLGKK